MLKKQVKLAFNFYFLVKSFFTRSCQTPYVVLCASDLFRWHAVITRSSPFDFIFRLQSIHWKEATAATVRKHRRRPSSSRSQRGMPRMPTLKVWIDLDACCRSSCNGDVAERHSFATQRRSTGLGWRKHNARDTPRALLLT